LDLRELKLAEATHGAVVERRLEHVDRGSIKLEISLNSFT
jgi:hypothetical protein